MSKTSYIAIAIFLVIILLYISSKQGYINIPFLNKTDKGDKNDNESGYSTNPNLNINTQPQQFNIPKFPYFPLPIKISNTKPNLAAAVVQLMANKYGAGLKVDGIYGPKTKAAVKSLLSQSGLSEGNGNITTTTISKIETALGVKPSGTWEQRVSKLYSTLNQ